MSFSHSKLSLISHSFRRNSCNSIPACKPPPSGPCGSLDLVSHPPPLTHPALPQTSLLFLTHQRHTPTSVPLPLPCPPGALFQDPHASTHLSSCSLPPLREPPLTAAMACASVFSTMTLHLTVEQGTSPCSHHIPMLPQCPARRTLNTYLLV